MKSTLKSKIFFGFLWTLPFFLVLASCEKTADNVEIPHNEPKPVVQSFLETGQDSVKLYLSQSNPVFYSTTNQTTEIKDAVVSISDGTNSVNLVYHPDASGFNRGSYDAVASALSFNSGNQINLNITLSDGKTLTSSCVLPAKPSFKIEFQEIVQSNGYGDKLLKFKFTDLSPNPENYYHIAAIVHGKQGNYIDEMELYDDSNYGGIYKISGGSSKTLSYYFWDNYMSIDSVKFYVLATDEHYYNYHKSVYAFEGDNPFAEPVIIYSNIKDGLGVFCGYNRNSQVVMLP